MKTSRNPHWGYQYKDPDRPACGWPLAILGAVASLALIVATMWLGHWAGF